MTDATESIDRQVWFTKIHGVEVRHSTAVHCDAQRPLCARALASGISQGTELLLYRGEGPERFDPSLDTPTAPQFPRRYGYAWVGEIVEIHGNSGHKIGERIFSLAPHGDYFVGRDDQVRVLPQDVPVSRSVLCANLETAVTVVWDAGISLGDRVVVLGGGIVGILVSWLALRAGASRVEVIEPSAKRRKIANFLGVNAHHPSDRLPQGDADVVIEASGRPELVDVAIAHAGREASVTIASFYGARTSTIALGDRFHRLRLKLRSSQVSTIPPERGPRWNFDRRFSLVLECLQDPRLDALIEPGSRIEDAASVYARLHADPSGSLQEWFSYR